MTRTTRSIIDESDVSPSKSIMSDRLQENVSDDDSDLQPRKRYKGNEGQAIIQAPTVPMESMYVTCLVVFASVAGHRLSAHPIEQDHT